MTNLTVTTEAIDALLPQTQCGLCGHGGCLPYAKAIAEQQAPIDNCPPGGITVLTRLAKATGQTLTPAMTTAMQAKAKPAQVATIVEAECIGCTKCIQACPVDAIVGSAKLMHTVITADCTGCELCLPPCPMDCITLVPVTYNETEQQTKAQHWRSLHQARQQRLAKVKSSHTNEAVITTVDKRQTIAAAIARAKAKRQTMRDN
jgi:Na+-translocating ferredoxin:NAD+ oxidoreductase subunit B